MPFTDGQVNKIGMRRAAILTRFSCYQTIYYRTVSQLAPPPSLICISGSQPPFQHNGLGFLEQKDLTPMEQLRVFEDSN